MSPEESQGAVLDVFSSVLVCCLWNISVLSDQDSFCTVV